MFVLTFPIYIRRCSQYSLIPVAHQLCVLIPLRSKVQYLSFQLLRSLQNLLRSRLVYSVDAQGSLFLSAAHVLSISDDNSQFRESPCYLQFTSHEVSYRYLTLMFLGTPLLPPQQAIPLLFPESSAPIRVWSILKKIFNIGTF